MINKITTEWLQKQKACCSGIRWFLSQKEREPIKVLKALMAENLYHDANWLIVRLMDRKQQRQSAIFAAEQVLHLFEKKYSEDKRPRLAIEAAKKVLENNTEEKRKADAAAVRAAAAYASRASLAAASAAAASAADAAFADADADADAAAASRAAARAAYASRDAAAYAADAAASLAAADAARAAYAAADADARKEMQERILDFGIGLLIEGKNAKRK